MKITNKKAVLFVLVLAVISLIALQLYTAKVATEQSKEMLDHLKKGQQLKIQRTDTSAVDTLSLQR